MGKPFLVVADADAIVAQAFPSDANHKKATEISKKLIQQNAQVLYPVTAVVEAVTVIQRVLSSGALARETAVVFSKLGMGMDSSEMDIFYVLNWKIVHESLMNWLFHSQNPDMKGISCKGMNLEGLSSPNRLNLLFRSPIDY